jgi:hypothetical protein
MDLAYFKPVHGVAADKHGEPDGKKGKAGPPVGRCAV